MAQAEEMLRMTADMAALRPDADALLEAVGALGIESTNVGKREQ